MVNWKPARQAVAQVFWHDRFKVYASKPTTNDIGEETEETGASIGEFEGNVQYQPISKAAKESGIVTPQFMRISCPKSINLIRGQLYAVEVTKARVQIKQNEIWEVMDWVESQISTVINCKRRETV